MRLYLVRNLNSRHHDPISFSIQLLQILPAPSDTDTAERRGPRNLITPFMQWRSRPLQSSTSITRAIIRSSSSRSHANGSSAHLAQADAGQRSSYVPSTLLVLAPESESAVPALEPPTEPLQELPSRSRKGDPSVAVSPRRPTTPGDDLPLHPPPERLLDAAPSELEEGPCATADAEHPARVEWSVEDGSRRPRPHSGAIWWDAESDSIPSTLPPPYSRT